MAEHDAHLVNDGPLNRVARHPAIRVAMIAMQEATRTPHEQESFAKAFGVFLNPTSQRIASELDLTYGGMEGFNPFNLDHWASDLGTGSKYGAIVTDAEKIGLANDVLTHAAGYPVDIESISAEEAGRILAGYEQSLNDELTEAAEGRDGVRITARAQDEKIDCFEVPKGVDRDEFEQHLKEQQDEINNTEIDKLQERRAAFRRKETVRDLRKQREARREWVEKRADQLRLAKGKSTSAATILANAESLLYDAPHALDMVAGGDPSNISGLTKSAINRSIGPQWRGKRVAQLDKLLDEQKKQGKTKPEIELEVC